MRIACPNCAAEYDVPDAALRPGRKLRCAACAADWVPIDAVAENLPDPRDTPPTDLPDEDAAAAEAEAPVPEDGDPPAGARQDALLDEASAAPQRVSLAPPHGTHQGTDHGTPARAARPAAAGSVWLGWGLTLMLVAAGVWSLWHWRGGIAHRWPASVRLYELLGVVVPRR